VPARALHHPDQRHHPVIGYIEAAGATVVISPRRTRSSTTGGRLDPAFRRFPATAGKSLEGGLLRHPQLKATRFVSGPKLIDERRLPRFCRAAHGARF
jgi:hypothetical protein